MAPLTAPPASSTIVVSAAVPIFEWTSTTMRSPTAFASDGNGLPVRTAATASRRPPSLRPDLSTRPGVLIRPISGPLDDALATTAGGAAFEAVAVALTADMPDTSEPSASDVNQRGRLGGRRFPCVQVVLMTRRHLHRCATRPGEMTVSECT